VQQPAAQFCFVINIPYLCINHYNMKLLIHRLDYKSPTDRNSYYSLPLLTSVNDITDANEVRTITAYFETKEEAEAYKALFPKSYNARSGGISGGDNYKFYVRFEFNTFWSNNSTGDKNETAIKRRDKVIAKIKSL
jgi:hypothetical protein